MLRPPPTSTLFPYTTLFRSLLVRGAVLQHECGDAEFVEELGDLLTLVVHRQPAVPAAGADDDRGAVGLVGRGTVDGDVRLVEIGRASCRGGVKMASVAGCSA